MAIEMISWSISMKEYFAEPKAQTRNQHQVDAHPTGLVLLLSASFSYMAQSTHDEHGYLTYTFPGQA